MIGRIRNWMVLLMLEVLLSGCALSRPIQIGFVGELSGRDAVLGVQARNGAQMAVDEINERGGIAGHTLEMLVYDNAGKVETLLSADQELIERKVVAITGHTTSWESIAALDLLEKEGMILFSPSTSTPALSQKSDNFYRLIPSSVAQSYPLAEYLANHLNVHRAAVLFEADNAAFTQTYADAFIQHFNELGGQITVRSSYSSSANPDFAQIITHLRSAGQADALLLVTSSAETALLAQQVRLQDWDVQLATSNWAYTGELLQNGGRAVEGILITSQFNSNCQNQHYLDFKSKYQDKYGQAPAFVAVISYETIQVLASALEQTNGRREGLGEALLKTGRYQGLCDEIIMDSYGDVQRTLYLVTVKGGAFDVIEEFPPGQ